MTGGDEASLAAAVLRGERAALAEALNLLDDRRPQQRQRAAGLLRSLAAGHDPAGGHLIGMTGPPGVGKSTLSAALIRVWRQRGHRVGVLAVDPASPLSGGALLGDRLRMKAAGDDPEVFVRSLSSRGEYGGLSAEVWPMSQVMLAACDIVLVETVGVGQREVDVATTCDTTCFIAQPGSGDTIQFLKAGILEVPHVMVVNKSDMGVVAERTLSELAGVLREGQPASGWRVPVIATSATLGEGVERLADALADHRALLEREGALLPRRRRHQAHWMVRRVAAEYGSAGIARLGGEQALLAELQQAGDDPLSGLNELSRRLAPGAATENP